MSDIATALRAIADNRESTGRPIKGKLKNLVVNTTLDEGWQVIVQYWFVDRWNSVAGADLVKCVSDALALPIDDRPLVRDNLPHRKLVDSPKSVTNELDDLLV